MEIISFFSYKGGVGRSLAVNQVAERLSEYGLSSLVIDFDLEAPGMHYKFKKDLVKIKERDGQAPKKGLVDYIHTFLIENDKKKLPDNFSDYYYTLPVDEKRTAPIWFMPAGYMGEGTVYWDKLSQIDWKRDFLLRGDDRMGSHLLVNLKGRFKKELNPDYILIDSRTGISDITTLTLRLMADTIVVIAINNPENLDGSETILKTMKAPENLWNNKEKELIFALSRFPKPSGSIEEAREEKITASIRTRFIPALVNEENFTILHEDRELSWGDKSISDTQPSEHKSLKEEHRKLFDIITRGNPKVTDAQREDNAQWLNADSLIVKANSLKDQGKFEDSLSVINQVEEKYRGFLFYFLRSYIFSQLKRYEDAISDYPKAIEFEPDVAAIYYNWGTDLCNLGWAKGHDEKLYQEAFSKYQKAIELNPDDAAVYYNWGTALSYLAEAKGNDENIYQQAFSKYQKAIELNPDNFRAYNTWGHFLLLLASSKNYDVNLLEQSKEKLLQAEKLKEKEGECSYDLTCVYSLLGDKDIALLYFEIALKFGDTTREYIAQDKDLDNIRSLPEFQRILDQYRPVR